MGWTTPTGIGVPQYGLSEPAERGAPAMALSRKPSLAGSVTPRAIDAGGGTRSAFLELPLNGGANCDALRSLRLGGCDRAT